MLALPCLTTVQSSWVAMVLYVLLLHHSCGFSTSHTYTQCASSEQLMKLTTGKPWSTMGNWTVWGECNLPNPRRDWAKCGRPGPAWLCDPDGLLTKEEADELDQQLNKTAMTSVCRCEDQCIGGGPRHVTVVVIVNWVRVPNLASGRSCEYGCASQVFPQLRPGSRPPLYTELDMMMDRITDHMLLTWGLDRCDDHVVIFYTKRYNRIHVKAGSIATARLRTSIHKALDAATPFFARNDIKGALGTILDLYYQSLGTKNTTSKLVGIVISIFVGAIIIFGIVITIVYCKMELSQGKNCRQVCAGTMGGHWAVLLGGGKPRRKEEEVAATAAELRNLES